MPDKKPKTPTEPFTMDDAWDGFKADFLPFVEWMVDSTDSFSFCQIEFIEDSPTAYKNKWSRDQWKIQVRQDGSPKIMSAGKRLFMTLREFCYQNKMKPSELGIVQVDRFGSGFETGYRVMFIKK